MAGSEPDSPEPRRALTHAGGDVDAGGDERVVATLTAAVCPPEDADPRYLTHAFHAWPARMHPHTARALIAATPAGATVLDPFMGGGTVPLEAMLAGRACYGRDLNPVALEVAWARTRLWSVRRTEALQAAAAAAVERARTLREERKVPAAFRHEEGPWYDPPALAEVWSLAEALRAEEDPGLARMLRACLSSILVKASRQASDSVPHQDRNHRWIPAGRVEQWYTARVGEHARNLAALSRAVPEGAVTPRLGIADARQRSPRLRGKVGAVITSPPYPGVYDYVEHQRRRYAALQLDPSQAEQNEMGARRELKRKGWMSAAWRFQDDLGRTMTGWRQVLPPGAPIFLVIGDGEHAQGLIRVLPLVEKAAEAAGLRRVARVSQARQVLGPARARTLDPRLEHVLALAVPG